MNKKKLIGIVVAFTLLVILAIIVVLASKGELMGATLQTFKQ